MKKNRKYKNKDLQIDLNNSTFIIQLYLQKQLKNKKIILEKIY